MAEVTTVFWDNGGVILTNGWDRGSRQKAVEKFKLDWADFEDRHELARRKHRLHRPRRGPRRERQASPMHVESCRGRDDVCRRDIDVEARVRAFGIPERTGGIASEPDCIGDQFGDEQFRRSGCTFTNSPAEIQGS